jgi:hypothetical protein
LSERRAYALERGQLRAATFARGDVSVERCSLGHIETAIVAVQMGHDRLIPIA